MENLSLNSQFFDSLESPVCLDYYLPPILVCSNGHSICSPCGDSVRCCPICRGAFVRNFRNLALESMLEQITMQCKFPGCTQLVTLKERQAHFQECPFNNTLRCIECPAVTEDLARHLVDVHSYKEILMNPEGGLRSFSGPPESWERDTCWPKGIWRLGPHPVLVHARSAAGVFHVSLYRTSAAPQVLALAVESADYAISFKGPVPHYSEFRDKTAVPHFNCEVSVLLDHFVKVHEEDEEILRLWVSVRQTS